MLIKDASKITGLTKKAIEYYTEQGLISPAAMKRLSPSYAEYYKQLETATGN